MLVGVEGGFIRRPVPEDGVVVSTDHDEFFLPEDKVIEALRALERVRATELPAIRPKRTQQMELPASSALLAQAKAGSKS